MEQYGRSSEGSRSDPSPEWGETGLQEPMWQLGLGGAGGGEESYPQRPDEADCTYYLRTGFCGFGERCRFNHPRDRAAVIGAARIAGGYPERLGQPVCQYYMRTRSCKFGASCKYDHPRQAGGGSTTSPVSLNYQGYPLRPGEKECYYVKTGQCKFGATCKFDHPPSAGVQIPAPSAVPPLSPLPVPVPSLYPTVQPQAGPSSQQIGVFVARPPLLPGSLVQSPYGPVVMSPTMVPMPGWGPYQASATSPLLPSSTPSNVGSAQLYGITQLPAYTGPYQPSGSSVGPSSGSQKEQTFPERPNQPEYQYYSKTGEFTIGSSYRYRQPPDTSAPKMNVVLGPAGLPLRPAALLFVYLAVASGIASFLQVSCWMVTGERQAARIRGLYLKTILKQDIAFFDTETTTGEVIGRMSGDTILIQDAMGEKVGKFIQLASTFFGGFAVAFLKDGDWPWFCLHVYLVLSLLVDSCPCCWRKCQPAGKLLMQKQEMLLNKQWEPSEQLHLLLGRKKQ